MSQYETQLETVTISNSVLYIPFCDHKLTLNSLSNFCDQLGLRQCSKKLSSLQSEKYKRRQLRTSATFSANLIDWIHEVLAIKSNSISPEKSIQTYSTLLYSISTYQCNICDISDKVARNQITLVRLSQYHAIWHTFFSADECWEYNQYLQKLKWDLSQYFTRFNVFYHPSKHMPNRWTQTSHLTRHMDVVSDWEYCIEKHCITDTYHSQPFGVPPVQISQP